MAIDAALIDFSKFLNGNAEERTTTAKAILHGFQNAGFIYLRNHAIPLDFVDHIFKRSGDFFALPDKNKQDVSWTTPKANRGYSAPGREKLAQVGDANNMENVRTAAPDLKESYEVGREGSQEHQNRWPEETDSIKGFKNDMLQFFGLCKETHIEVMRAIAVGMNLDESFFDSFLDVGDNTLRLLHYPAVDSSVFKKNPNTVRAGAHSDYGSITLLFQDKSGGLQVQSPNGQFVDGTPIDGTIVVNAGDLLARWSNDSIKSTIHRVVEPPTDQDVHPPRYSIAYFCNPNFKDTICALPGTYASKDKRYEDITSGDYLTQRLTATY
ncbi:hypothetical protein F66182_968 [Fusarium sp. NRRL 66182]|nr:hypothetical protein F66182_968 [Fusarium sp. NRRL 66182]